jgi:hypothetical protein
VDLAGLRNEGVYKGHGCGVIENGVEDGLRAIDPEVRG